MRNPEDQATQSDADPIHNADTGFPKLSWAIAWRRWRAAELTRGHLDC